ncbi:MAG: hypothetical protein M3Z17_08925 [Gemmatimonadota bacterium]|nr:hypothetical protein [Gemmatimonadota bacterium]
MPLRRAGERSASRVIGAPARLALDFALFASVIFAYPFLALARRVTGRR